MIKIKHIGWMAAAVVSSGLLNAPTSSAQPAKAGAVGTVPNLIDLADRIVGKTANVKESEIVLIQGGPDDLVFMEELAVAVRKRGAHPLLTIWSESGERKMVAAMPEKYDSQAPAVDLGLAKLVNVMIVLPPVRDPSIAAALPPARRAAIAKAAVGAADLRLKRNVRLVELSNGMAPSPSRAKLLGVTEAELAKMYWDGLTADYSSIETRAKALQDQLSKGGELHITLANGTDLKMKIKGRKVLTSDGVMSDADVKAGGAAVNAWLPAGEVMVTPVPGSAEGKIVDDRMVVDGKELTGVTAEIKAGKITSVTAKTGWEAVKERWDAAGPGKTEISVFDLGINPAVKTGGKLETYVGAGSITIAAGNNIWAGGTNKEPYSLMFQMAGTTVTLDGKPLVENGTIK